MAVFMELQPRANIPLRYQWDLGSLYASIDTWKTDLAKTERDLQRIDAYRGKLGSSAEVLQEALETYLGISRNLEKLYTYAHLQSDQDTSDATNLGYLEQAFSLYTRFSAASSYINPEVLSIPDETFQSFLQSTVLKPYKRLLEDIVRYRPHTLSPSEEQLLAEANEVLSGCDKVFSQLNNADLTFGSIEADGQSVAVTHGSFVVLLQRKDRDLRRKVYKQYYDAFGAHKNTLGATLTGSIKRNIYISRVRNYESSLRRAIFHENVGPEVYNALVSTVSAKLKPLHRYYAIRRKLLKLDELQMYDTYVPLVPEVQTKQTYEEAAQLVIDALKPMGSEYVSVLKKGLLEERWVDVFENKGKRSGAYHSGCYDSYPYMLLNYKEEGLNSIFTLAHEAGHAMHSYFANRHQPYQDAGYSIFVAEVASTFNEQLLLTHLKEVYRSNKPLLAYLINHQLDEIKGTLYRQTMFAEFEKDVHERAEQNEPLTINTYRQAYTSLLEKYFGGEVALNEEAWLECLRIPHFYSAFYVYKYATGISAAIALAQKVQSGGEAERKSYLGFLSAGGSKYPLDLLKEAGVDMRSGEAVVTALDLFDSQLTELESAMAHLI